MSGEITKKPRLGKKEKAILDFLAKYPNGIWKEDILNSFAISSKYRTVMIKRLYRMAQKGLIEIKNEINPETGRSKQRVYLNQ